MGSLSDTDLVPRPSTPPAAPVSPSRFLCPYCGHVGSDANRCPSCRGLFEPLSRQATQNAMGPWQIRDEDQPHRPGASLETLRKLIERGKIGPETVIRGPTTRQFWNFARNTPGVAVLLGECHACHRSVRAEEYICGGCGATLHPATDRQTLGLAPVKLLPGAAGAREIAASSFHARPPVGGPPVGERPVGPSTGPAPPPPLPRVERVSPAAARDGGESEVADRRTRAANRRLRRSLKWMTVALIAALAVNAATLGVLAVALLGPGGITESGPAAGAAAERAVMEDQEAATPQNDPAAGAPATADQMEQGAASEGGAEVEGAPQELPPEQAGGPAEAPAAEEAAELSPEQGSEGGASAGEPNADEPAADDGARAGGLELSEDLAPWRAQIDRGTELMWSDSTAEVERAVQLLREALESAAEAAGVERDAARERFPVLGARLGAAEERLARLREREAF